MRPNFEQNQVNLQNAKIVERKGTLL